MFRVVILFACVVLCHSHAVVSVVVPAAHTLSVAPLVAPYPLHYGYGAGLLGHSYLAKPFGHHILKRSPYAPLVHVPLAHVAPYTHVAPVAHVGPLAFSHQSRVDVHTSPAVVAAPIVPVVKPVIAPILPVAPLIPKVAPLHYGGHYGAIYPHYGYGR